MGPLLTVQGVGAVAAGLVASRVVRRYGEPAHRPARAPGRRRSGLGLVVVVDRVWELMAAVGVLGAGLPLIFVAFNTLCSGRRPRG